MGQCCSGRTLSDDQKAAKKDAKFKEGLINKTTSSATSSSAVLGKYKPTRTRNHCLIPPIFNDLPTSTTRIDGEGTYVRRSTLFRCVATMVRTCFAHASGPTAGGGLGQLVEFAGAFSTATASSPDPFPCCTATPPYARFT